MSGTAVGTSRVLLHGTIPVPGVWHWEGKASRNDVNGPAWRKSQIGINYEASVGNDFMASGTFFSNSGATTQSATRPKELHLQANLVPRAHDREHDVRTSEGGSLEPQWRHSSDMSTLGTYSPASPSLSPSRRVSAIRIEDATSWAASPTGASATSASPTGASASLHASPQRMFVNGQWRLESSLHPSKSSPEFSSHSRQIANSSSTVGKHFPPRLDHKQYMADNWRLGEAHDERLRLEVRGLTQRPARSAQHAAPCTQRPCSAPARSAPARSWRANVVLFHR